MYSTPPFDMDVIIYPSPKFLHNLDFLYQPLLNGLIKFRESALFLSMVELRT